MKKRIGIFLKRKEAYRVMKFLDANRQYTATTSSEQIAKELSEKFGFPISGETINNMRRDMGIETIGKIKTSRKIYTKKILILAEAIRFLYHELDIPLPIEIGEMAKKLDEIKNGEDLK